MKIQFCRKNLLITDHFFLRPIQQKYWVFNLSFWIAFITVSDITSNNCNNVVSPVYAVFVIFCWHSKNKIPEAALELCQFKIKQLTKHEDNHFTLNCYVVPSSFLFIFHAGSRGLGSNNSRNSSYKEKTAGLARVSRLPFRFLLLWLNHCCCLIYDKSSRKAATSELHEKLLPLNYSRKMF